MQSPISWIRSTVLVLLVCLLGSASLTAAAPTSIFDGNSLDGWEGDRQHWRVEDGTIVGEIPPDTKLTRNTWLIWRGGTISDFELNLQFMLGGSAGANSGIQIRCQAESINHVSGYQADLDMGAVWLGRLYDEHGRALLVERGSRVHISNDGKRSVRAFAPAKQYSVLFREGGWNDYRIVAVADRIDVYVNGTLFSSLKDEQDGERDLSGLLAFQLHSGGETRIAFRDITIENLGPNDSDRLAEFAVESPHSDTQDDSATENVGVDVGLGFESGTLEGWEKTGNAFDKQPLDEDSIASRWRGQTSNKQGSWFIGGFEVMRDAATGTLTSDPLTVTHPYASFLIGGGESLATRVEIMTASGDETGGVVFTATGQNREQMRRVVADLRHVAGQKIIVRLVDESSGGWGHLNFDDFRFHETPPQAVEPTQTWRSTFNPILQHLVPNPVKAADTSQGASHTLEQMQVPRGFSVDLIASEPAVHQPMAFTFDAKGRLWVVEGHSYPQKRPEGEGLDRILIFSDEDGDGSFEHRTVFCEGLNLVSGLEVGHGGVWVGAAPELLFIPDRDGDDRPDSEPQVLLNGFGYADTHETINSFVWGPDGWLYGNQGVFNKSLIGKPDAPEGERVSLGAGVWRFHPKRHQFEVFAHGGSNQWGLDFDQHGQLFMTHCRSHHGQGLTTHVMQGGHYWNQVNGGYAAFISPSPLAGMPWMKNYLLASARYGHGEGGAGKTGTREVYGGHSHVGTMIYLGDNWPPQYRNHLFTHNLHGHQLNHQINRREAGGYNTVHAGRDMLFCGDQQYIGIDLNVGPDGAVYISDWYDPRHCHNPNVEHWDRGNGRIYRMKYDATYRSTRVDYTTASESELVAAQTHPNDWHARMARLVLSQRVDTSPLSDAARSSLVDSALNHADVVIRLRSLWTLHAAGALDESTIRALLNDDSEYVRGWAIQLACESGATPSIASMIASHSESERSLFVARYLASAIGRLPSDQAWRIAETLSRNTQITSDRDLPLLLWHAMAPLVESDIERAFVLADSTENQMISDYIRWYAAKSSEQGREKLAAELGQADGTLQPRLLRLFSHAIRGMRGLEPPAAWATLAESFYESNDLSVRREAETIGAAFADARLFDRLRMVISDVTATSDAKVRALSLLGGDVSEQTFQPLVKLLDDPQLAVRALPLLSRYDAPIVPERVLKKLPNWDGPVAAAAMDLLTNRIAWSHRLLDAIADGSISKDNLSAYYAQQMSNLGDQELNERLTDLWGSVGRSSAELKDEIAKTVDAFSAAPKWAFSESAGAATFKKLCANCHQPGDDSLRLAPKLQGTGSKGIQYIVENIIDPNAVIGRDFQAQLVLTDGGQVFTGLVEQESDSAIILRTATDTVTIAKDEIAEQRVSENSFMPAGLLNPLNERERIELLKYLMSM